MSERFHLAAIVPIDMPSSFDEEGEKISIVSCIPEKIIINETTTATSTPIKSSLFDFYTKLFNKYKTNKLVFKTARFLDNSKMVIIKKNNELFMPNEFRRELDAMIKDEFLVIDKSTNDIFTRPYTKHTASMMFLQALQICAPESFKNFVNNMIHSDRGSAVATTTTTTTATTTPSVVTTGYNSRSTCCFENVMLCRNIRNIRDKSCSLEFGYLPHSNCSSTEYEKRLIRNKIIKWYLLS